MYENRIKHLKDLHRSLDDQIFVLERDHPYTKQETLTEMKKRKLALRDEIARLERLEWEDQHERLHYDDERR